MRILKPLVVILVIAVVGVVAYAYSGHYDVAVGSGHNPVTAWYLETIRERSIETRAAELSVPADVDDADRVAAGGRYYKRGCVFCHGSPGREPTSSFEPRPPALAKRAVDPKEAFWVIRNGIKMSAMPKHARESDQEIWNIVAFMQRLPDLDKEQYQVLTSESGAGAETESAEPADGESGNAESPSPAAEGGESDSDGTDAEAGGEGTDEVPAQETQGSETAAGEGAESQSDAEGSSQAVEAVEAAEDGSGNADDGGEGS